MLEKLHHYDLELLFWINRLGEHTSPALWELIASITTWFPLFLFIILLFFVYLDSKRAVLASIFFNLTGVAALLAKELTKNAFQRLRPCNVEGLRDSLNIIGCKDSFSFFSGHATFSFAITLFVVLTLRQRLPAIYLFFLWPLLFVTSRLVGGVHYPSDILVGATVGTVIGFLSFKLFEQKWMKLPPFAARIIDQLDDKFLKAIKR